MQVYQIVEKAKKELVKRAGVSLFQVLGTFKVNQDWKITILAKMQPKGNQLYEIIINPKGSLVKFQPK